MANVLEFREFIMREVHVVDHFQFCSLSEQHCEFWTKLNKIWINKGISTEVENVDEAAQLSEKEWQELEKEFRSLN